MAARAAAEALRHMLHALVHCRDDSLRPAPVLHRLHAAPLLLAGHCERVPLLPILVASALPVRAAHPAVLNQP